LAPTDDNTSPSPGSGVRPVSISDEMRRSYLDYAMSVIVSRALPDVRDGLKPVHRRILYSMHENNYTPDRPYNKSARVTGDTMGKYHPHGNLAIYDALVRMAQPFSMRLPLIDGQGNFGSVDGDPPAAERYTEVRLAPAAMPLLDDLDNATVDFQPNYDGREREPTVLPAKFPNLLVNGAGGIAVGMATNIPPHNLGEVIDAAIALIDRPEMMIEDLMAIVPGPDFPTGGSILGRAGIRIAYMSGRGSVLTRAKVEVEELRKEREALIVTEIPYQVNKAALIEKIAELVREKRIEGISDLRDESDRDGMRIVIEIGGHIRAFGESENAFQLLPRGALDRVLDLVGCRLAFGDEFEIDDGHIGSGHADRRAVEFAVELGQDEADGARRSSRSRDHRKRGRAGPVKVLVHCIQRRLVAGIGVNRRHESCFDADRVV